MYQIDVFKMQKFFEEHGITQFNIVDVEKSEGKILIKAELIQDNPLYEYIVKNKPKKLVFKNYEGVYVAEKFYVNYEGTVATVYTLTHNGKIVDVMTFYEIENTDIFSNENSKINIDKIIEEN